MDKKRIIITGIVLSIVYIILDYVVHGVLLHDIYMQTSSVWRTEDDMSQLSWMMFLAEIIFAFVFAAIYAKGYERGKGGLWQGYRFGLLMGLLLGPAMGLSWYVVLPIPGILAVYWAVAMFVDMIILGMVAGLVYKS